MEREKIEKRIQQIKSNFNNQIKFIKSYTDDFPNGIVKNMFKGLSDEDVELVCNEIINDKLNIIIENADKDFILNTFYDVLNIVDFFSTKQDNEGGEVEEAGDVIYDILRKFIVNENRTIDYPINTKYLMEYSIDVRYSDEQIKNIMKWIIIHLFVIEEYLKKVQSK